MSQTLQQQNFNQLVALFLAEAIRTRRTSLARAAEILQRVVASLPSLNSEPATLAKLTELEKDFQEIRTLKESLHFGVDVSKTNVYEQEIKDFASKIFAKDMPRSAEFLNDAAAAGMTIQKLCLKYPDFCEYLFAVSEKAGLISEKTA